MAALCALFLLVLATSTGQAKVKLSEVSTVYLPYTTKPKPMYRPFSAEQLDMTFDVGGAVEQLTYDVKNHFIYVTGQGILHVVNASDPTNMTHVTSIELGQLDL